MSPYIIDYLFHIPDFFRVIMTAPAIILLSVFASDRYGGAQASSTDTSGVTEQGYRIDQPGTITFTVGVKISGKVEKPQVMIFLTKEKPLYREEAFSRSFSDELSQPLPFTPVIPQAAPQ